MSTLPSFQQFRRLAQPPSLFQRTGQEKWYGLWIRPISVRLSWLINRFRFITPNMVTVFMIFWSLIASALIIIPGIWGVIAFFLAFQFWTALDSIDGELARFRQQFSNAGVYLDNIAHHTVHFAVFVAIGWKYYLISGDIFYLFLGLSSAIIMAFNGSIYLSSKYHTLVKQIILPQGGYKTNIILHISREMLGHIEISMIGALALALYIIRYDSPLVPHLFFALYIILSLGGSLWMIYYCYRTLTKSH